MNIKDIEKLSDSFVLALIREGGFWIKRDGVDLDIRITPHTYMAVMRKLHEYRINIKSNIVIINGNNVCVRFSKITTKKECSSVKRSA